jgi:hypothetical protein
MISRAATTAYHTPAGSAVPHSPLQIASHLQRLRITPDRILGRERELATIRESIRARRPLFVCGPAGVGKTAVLQAIYGTWNAPQEGLPVFYCGDSRTRRELTTHLLVNLLVHHGRLQSEYIGRRTSVASLSQLRRFVEQARLPHLKRMMHQGLQRERGCLFLDHVDQPDSRIAGLIEVWLETTPLVVVARDAASVGRVRWLLSAFEKLTLLPLPEMVLLELAGAAATRLGLRLTDADLREVAKRAAGNPGRLQQLLHAATHPKYQQHGTVQWKLVDLDLRIRAIGLADPERSPRSSS